MGKVSGYQVMWAWVLFDLPVGTKIQRSRATRFRNYLLDEGFAMSQFSVYLKLLGSREKTDALFDRIERNVPPEGSVHCIGITDKQFGRIRTYKGKNREDIEKPEQLTFL